MGRRRSSGDEFSKRLEQRIEQALLDKVTPKPELPEGIVSVVFTDVVESTAIVRRLGDAAARDLLRRHDAVVRATLAEHAGIEVERDGDGFVLAFTLASRAVTFGLAIHRSLADAFAEQEEPIQLRIGIDTGEVLAEGKGYFGTTVIRASRIEGLARPGGTLVSDATKVIAEAALSSRPDPVPIVFRPAGSFELKGLEGEHPLFEVAG